MNKATQKVLFSSEQSEWETPPDFFKMLDRHYKFTLDAAASDSNHLCKKYFTEKDDALSRSWGNERVFINPPYGRGIGAWTAHAFEEAKKGTFSVMLLPARMDTKWFHEWCHESRVRLIQGRLMFLLNGKPMLDKKGNPTRAPFPSMLVYFEPEVDLGRGRWIHGKY